MDVNEYGRALSPSSRTEAIVRGQRELMEMVRNMPESNYELSLKDLVEHQHWRDAPQENSEENEEEKKLKVYKKQGSARKVDKMAHVKRTGSNIDRGGFYLKVGFPFSFGSKDKKDKNKNNKKKNESSGNSSSKVSPKPSAKGVVDKEWWKKSPSACKGSKDSESGESNINSESMKSSGSSSSSNSNGSRRSSSRYVPNSNLLNIDFQFCLLFFIYIHMGMK